MARQLGVSNAGRALQAYGALKAPVLDWAGRNGVNDVRLDHHSSLLILLTLHSKGRMDLNLIKNIKIRADKESGTITARAIVNKMSHHKNSFSSDLEAHRFSSDVLIDPNNAAQVLDELSQWIESAANGMLKGLPSKRN